MMFLGIFGLLYVPLLLINAVAILNEERFLAKIGWSTRTSANGNSGFGNEPSYDGSFGGGNDSGISMKTKAVGLISSVRTLMRPPLVVLNVLVILYEILAG